MTQENRAAFIAAQSRCERVAQAFGDSAPPATVGECLQAYRARLLSQYKQHSAQWRGVELYSVGLDALDVIEPKIYADAMVASRQPDDPDTLREIIETDRGGRKISRFYGSPEACWGVFKQVPRYVVGWNTK